ncbi:MAG: glyoxalase [Alphaproteobacteria bacterium]|nr:MAG: glyoxalase [Alphaproteobacteria bacterium]
MTETETHYKVRPPQQRWTHLALIVKDIDASIEWYEKHTHLELLSRNEDESGHGAWLGDRTQADSPFILVLAQFFKGKDPFAPAHHGVLGPFAHIGIEVTERSNVDEIAELAEEEGCLALGPVQMPRPVGYICFLKDPDGNTVEFSHDQGVYEEAKKVWGTNDTP